MKRTAEFLAAMSTAFRPVKAGLRPMQPELGRLEQQLPRPPMERQAPREPRETEALVPPQVPRVRYNPVVYSSDEEDTAASDREEVDVVMEEETETRKRFMGPADVHFTKWQRLIPANCKPFTVVQQWHEFRVQRAGGSKKEEHQKNSMHYVNRFLAHCDFSNCNWRSVTPSMVTKHDAELARHFEAGTVSRILQTILDFWTWARNNKYLRRSHYDSVREYLEGCLRSSRKDVDIRNTQRRVEEAANLPEPDVLGKFENSEYVKKLRESFRTSPFIFLYDMACCIIVLCSFYNGPRVSVFHNLRIKDVENASTDDGLVYTLTVGKHKTSGRAGGRSKKAAFITLSKDKYLDLLLYTKTVRDVYKYIDPTAPVFRNRNGEPVSTNLLGKMAKTAWKKAGMEGSMSMTVLRKLTTVQGRKTDPGMAGSIARQLCHRQSTGDQYYAVHDDRAEAVRVYHHLKASFSKPTATITSAEAEQQLHDPFSLSGTGTNTPVEPETISESTLTEQQSILTADSDIIPPSDKGESLPRFTATKFNINPTIRLRRLRPKEIELGRVLEEPQDDDAPPAPLPEPPLTVQEVEPQHTPLPPPPLPVPSPQMPVLSPAPQMKEMPVLSPALQKPQPLAHLSKYVPVVQFTPTANYKKRVRVDPAKRHEIREAYQEIILEYMMLPFRSVPMQAIRDLREGRWPELTDMQLRDMVRNMVKAQRRQDIRDNPDDYLLSE